MTIDEVTKSLRNTIAGKQAFLVEMQKQTLPFDQFDRVILTCTIEFLKVNIDELKLILKDVEECEVKS